jgi:hypothetical protein
LAVAGVPVTFTVVADKEGVVGIVLAAAVVLLGTVT